MSLIDCKRSLILTWLANYIITDSKYTETFKITDTKLYVPVVTLPDQDNIKLLQQLKSWLSRTINWNKYLTTPKTLAQNQDLNYLIDPRFQGVNTLFALSFVENAVWTGAQHSLSRDKNKRLQRRDWWFELFWPVNKKWHKKVRQH